MDRPDRSRVSGSLALPLAVTILFLGCAYEELGAELPFDPDLYELQGHGIVGGTTTTAWPAIGVYFNTAGYMCTATLVDPGVVLTAAHCTDGSGNQDYFCRGSNINNMTGNDCHLVDDAINHPSYNFNNQHPHDVAVLTLWNPTNVVDPIRVNTTSMNSWTGDWLHYVGFGSNTTYGGGGSGIKRETDLQIDAVGSYEYQNYTPGTNICSGDSGGPGLVQLGNEWHVAGVNSSVWAQSGDPCSGYSIDMRVDAELNFLDDFFDPYAGDDDASDDDASDDDASDDDASDDDAGDDDASDDDGAGDDDSIDPADYPEPRVNANYDRPEGCACDATARPAGGPLAALAALLGTLSLLRRRA